MNVVIEIGKNGYFQARPSEVGLSDVEAEALGRYELPYERFVVMCDTMTKKLRDLYVADVGGRG